jgi:acyl phosphate:glycerol-3-phosphate acyltransferase
LASAKRYFALVQGAETAHAGGYYSDSMTAYLLIAAISYLLGSIPFGYLLVRIFRDEDVRQSGSGNVGATNVARKSPLLGVLTLLLDAAKGAAAVSASYLLAERLTESPTSVQLALAALCAIAGHMFPLWLKFRGGKGVATGLGSFMVIAPKAVLLAIIIFLAIASLTRYVSLGSIVAVAVFPFFAWWLRQFGVSPLALGMMALASLLIVLKHHQNIGRLLAGTENRFGAKPA